MACPTFLTCTLQDIRDHEPCADGWANLLRSLDTSDMATEVTLLQILDSNGLYDALWALRAMPDSDAFARLLACDYVERVLPFYEQKYPGDNRPRHAIAVARRFAIGQATRQELSAAWAAAEDAAGAAATHAARAAASAAVCAAVCAAGDAAWTASGAAARAAARAAERAWQEQHLRQRIAEAMEEVV